MKIRQTLSTTTTLFGNREGNTDQRTHIKSRMTSGVEKHSPQNLTHDILDINLAQLESLKTGREVFCYAIGLKRLMVRTLSEE